MDYRAVFERRMLDLEEARLLPLDDFTERGLRDCLRFLVDWTIGFLSMMSNRLILMSEMRMVGRVMLKSGMVIVTNGAQRCEQHRFAVQLLLRTRWARKPKVQERLSVDPIGRMKMFMPHYTNTEAECAIGKSRSRPSRPMLRKAACGLA